MSEAQKISNQLDAWRKKQNPWITVENTNKGETNKKFIKVRANDYWGNPEPKKDKH